MVGVESGEGGFIVTERTLKYVIWDRGERPLNRGQREEVEIGYGDVWKSFRI